MRVYIIIPVVVFYSLSVAFSAIAFGQQVPQTYTKVSSLFLPLPDLVYGPNSSQVNDLHYRYIKVNGFQDNERLIIYNPDIFVDRINVSHIPKGKNLTVDLDSFFSLNRQLPQSIPEESNIIYRLNLSKISNPAEAADVTQMKLDNSVILPLTGNDSGNRPVFTLPSDLGTGDYLVDVSLMFPDSKVEATYSTRIAIDEANSTDLT